MEMERMIACDQSSHFHKDEQQPEEMEGSTFGAKLHVEIQSLASLADGSVYFLSAHWGQLQAWLRMVMTWP